MGNQQTKQRFNWKDCGQLLISSNKSISDSTKKSGLKLDNW